MHLSVQACFDIPIITLNVIFRSLFIAIYLLGTHRCMEFFTDPCVSQVYTYLMPRWFSCPMDRRI